MIRNGRFTEAGAAPGAAAGWTLRSVCQAEQIAPFGAPVAAPSESFDGWARFTPAFGDGTLVRLVLSNAVAIERFDWPIPTLREELSGGMVAAAFRDSFVWTSAPFAASWADVASMGAAFAGSARETFERGWRAPDGALVTALPDAVAVRAAFQGQQAETFEAGWTPNPTLR